MVSVVDTAKRALVTLIKSLAAIYSVTVTLTRDSSDSELKAAYKKVSRKAHPDQGGATEHQKALNAEKDSWEDALRASKPHGGNNQDKSKDKSADAPLVKTGRKDAPGFRFQGDGDGDGDGDGNSQRQKTEAGV